MTAFQAGDYAKVTDLFDQVNGVVVQRYSQLGAQQPKKDADAPASTILKFKDFVVGIQKLTKLVGNPIYQDRSLMVSEDGSRFIEQHCSLMSFMGTPLKIDAVLIGHVNATSGKITRLEEYLDPSPLMALMSKAAAAMAKSKKGAGAAAAKAGGFTDDGTDGLPQGTESAKGLVVVVTGASSGIGASIATLYAQHGAIIILGARSLDSMEKLKADLEKKYPSCTVIPVRTDVSKQSDCENLISVASKAGNGKIHRIYLNAGVSQNTRVEESGPGLEEIQMGVNFFGSTWTTRAALPFMFSAADAAKSAQADLLLPRITVVGSLLGRLPAPKNAAYSASKHALHGWFESLRIELQPRGIQVCISLPGPVSTGILSNLYGPHNSLVSLIIAKEQMSSMTTADEAARLTVLATEKRERDIVFPDALKQVYEMRSGNRKSQEVADKVMGGMYNGMQHKVVSEAKL